MAATSSRRVVLTVSCRLSTDDGGPLSKRRAGAAARDAVDSALLLAESYGFSRDDDVSIGLLDVSVLNAE